MAEFDALRKQLCREKRTWRLSFERSLNVQRHATAEILEAHRQLMRAGIERASAALRSHAFALIAPQEDLAIDAQLDLIVASRKKLNSLRFGHEEESLPPRADLRARQLGLVVEKSQVDGGGSRLDRRTTESGQGVERPGEAGLRRHPRNDRRKRRHTDA